MTATAGIAPGESEGEMKVVTYVMREEGDPFVMVEHDIREGYSAREECDYWIGVCCMAMNKGKIVNFRVDLVLDEDER